MVKYRPVAYISTCAISHLIAAGILPRAISLTPHPDGLTSAYVSPYARTSCTHGFSLPVLGSRHLSRSYPVSASLAESTKPTPGRPSTRARFSASSYVPQVRGSLLLAYRPVCGSIGGLVGLPFRCSYRQATHCGISLSSLRAGMQRSPKNRSIVFIQLSTLIPYIFKIRTPLPMIAALEKTSDAPLHIPFLRGRHEGPNIASRQYCDGLDWSVGRDGT